MACGSSREQRSLVGRTTLTDQGGVHPNVAHELIVDSGPVQSEDVGGTNAPVRTFGGSRVTRAHLEERLSVVVAGVRAQEGEVGHWCSARACTGRSGRTLLLELL